MRTIYNQLIKITLVLGLMCIGVTGWGQSICTNPIIDADPSASNPYTNGQIVDPNITFSGIGRSAGIIGVSSPDRYNANGWNTNRLNPKAYFTLELTCNAGFEIDFKSFVYTGQTSAPAQNRFAIRTSLDGFTDNIAVPTDNSWTIDLEAPEYQGIRGSIEFRIYAWGAPEPGDAFSINDFTFHGTVRPSTAGCVAPAGFPGGFSATNITATSMDINWSDNGPGDQVLVMARQGSPVDAIPTSGVSYTANAGFGSGDEVGVGNYVVYTGAGSSVLIHTLSPFNTYHYSVFSFNTVDNCYNETPLTGNATTICEATNVSELNVNCGNTVAFIDWQHAVCYDDYIVIAKEGSSITAVPTGDGSAYTGNLNYGHGTPFDGGFVVYKGINNNIEGSLDSLTNFESYFFKVFTRDGITWSDGIEVTCTPVENADCIDETFSTGATPADWIAMGVSWTEAPGRASFNEATGELTTYAVFNPQHLEFLLARTSDLAEKSLFVEVSTTSQTADFTMVAEYNHRNTIREGTTVCTVDLMPYINEDVVYIRFRKESLSQTTSPWRLDNAVVVCGFIVLPVDLLSFDATLRNKQVHLDWAFDNANGFDRFAVEHATDRQEWAEIGVVHYTEGTSRSSQEQFTHTRPAIGNNYYRLRMIDEDGSEKLSLVESVQLRGSGGFTPVNTLVDYELLITRSGSDESAQLTIIDLQGRVMETGMLPEFEENTQMNMSEMAPGIYLLQVVTSSDRHTFKVVKK